MVHLGVPTRATSDPMPVRDIPAQRRGAPNAKTNPDLELTEVPASLRAYAYYRSFTHNM